MRSSVRHLRILERRTRHAAIAGGGAVISATCWAAWTLGSVPATVSSIGPADLAEPVAVTPIAAAFEVNLWPDRPPTVVADATKAASPPPPPPPQPLDVQLLGIAEDVNSEGHVILRAALYERGTGRVLLVTDGEVVQGRLISEVTASTVRLTLGEHSQTLSLEPGGRP